MADEEEELLQLAIQQSLMEGRAGREEGGGGLERERRESGVERMQQVLYVSISLPLPHTHTYPLSLALSLSPPPSPYTHTGFDID